MEPRRKIYKNKTPYISPDLTRPNAEGGGRQPSME